MIVKILGHSLMSDLLSQYNLISFAMFFDFFPRQECQILFDKSNCLVVWEIFFAGWNFFQDGSECFRCCNPKKKTLVNDLLLISDQKIKYYSDFSIYVTSISFFPVTLVLVYNYTNMY